jgi:hypothetical protein
LTNIRAILGAVIVAVGVLTLAVVEWRYLPAANKPLDVRIALDHATTLSLPPFTLDRDGAYEVWFQADRTAGIEAFGCLTAESGFEKLCPERLPELDATWTLTANGAAVARGGSDLAGWMRRRAAVDPRVATNALHDFRDFQTKTANPSDSTPLYHQLGSFAGRAGETVQLALRVNRAAPTLAALHPRLIVGLSSTATRGLGLMAVLFCVLCVFGGGFMLLTALVPRQRTDKETAA